MEKVILASLLGLQLCSAQISQNDFYQKESIPTPSGVELEISCLSLASADTLVLGTRRGEIWRLSDIHNPDVDAIKWELLFNAAHEPLGIYERDGWIYFTDRDAFARIGDQDQNGSYESYEVISNSWGITGDYHEYNFGTSPDKNGDVWIVHCLTGSYSAKAQWRGWAQKVSPDGTTTPVASGIRSPGGIGFNALGDVFYTDNQGLWNGTSCLKHLKPGSFTGNPSGNKFYKDAPHMGKEPPFPKNGSRIASEAERIPEFVPPAIQFPHGKVGQSPTSILSSPHLKLFGLPSDQIIIGEHTHSELQRVFLEEVNGVYQGAVWKFINNMDTGVLSTDLSSKGTLFAGGSVRGWPSRGQQRFALERLSWNGTYPLEMQKVEALSDGFKVTFSEPIDPNCLTEDFCSIEAWTYIYQGAYGSPEVDHVTPKVLSHTLDDSRTVLKLKVSALTKGHVHHLKLHNILSTSQKPLWHNDVYYTLNQIPSE